ncbi:hypothetical protein EDD16DRAFT_1500648, partial [Pisolithus croceorrhizus]
CTQIHISRNVKFMYAGQERLGEVQYFVRLTMDATAGDAEEAQFEDIAIIHLYTIPDKSLVQDLSHMFMVSKLSDRFIVTYVKSIKSIVGMIPYHLRHPSGIIDDCFFLMEKPGLDISQLGESYNVYQEEDDQSADIE